MSVAKVYAKALFEFVSEKSSITGLTVADAEKSLSAMAQQVETSSVLKTVLTSPVTSAKEKQDVIDQVSKKMQIAAPLAQFFSLLVKKNRFVLIDSIQREFQRISLNSQGAVLGDLISASEISQSEIDSLSSAFSKKIGKKVVFKTATDTSLLAGVKVTVNGVTYDGTLRSQLQRLRERFVLGTGASH